MLQGTCKPENILMAEDDCEFKPGDFGLATQIGLEGLHLLCGSPGYLAPEMLRRSTYGAQVDMFSCGVLLYYLLSGRMPFEDNSPSEVLTKNKECRMYFQPQFWSKISKDAIELVLKLTHPNPLQRPTPEQALTHAWLSTKVLNGSVKAVRIASGMRSITTCDHISHKLMMRSLNKMEAKPPCRQLLLVERRRPAVWLRCVRLCRKTHSMKDILLSVSRTTQVQVQGHWYWH
jgi:serine/threonine protein kinase